MVLSMEKWVGKVAVVTGASAGIGAAIVKQLVENGMKVVGFARRVQRVEELGRTLSGKRGQLYAIKADVTIEEDVLSAFKWVKDNLGPVHVLVNNAGLNFENTLIGGDSKKWRIVFDTNVLGLCVTTREAVEIMKMNQIDGHIIHINSIVGHKVVSNLDVNVYSASKFAVTALTETLRNELREAGLVIKVTSISPGVVSTDFVRGHSEEKQKRVAALPALEAEDIADAVLYALSTPFHVQVHEITIKPIGEPF